MIACKLPKKSNRSQSSYDTANINNKKHRIAQKNLVQLNALDWSRIKTNNLLKHQKTYKIIQILFFINLLENLNGNLETFFLKQKTRNFTSRGTLVWQARFTSTSFHLLPLTAVRTFYA